MHAGVIVAGGTWRHSESFGSATTAKPAWRIQETAPLTVHLSYRIRIEVAHMQSWWSLIRATLNQWLKHKEKRTEDLGLHRLLLKGEASFPSARRDRLRLPPPAAPCRSRARRASITQCRDWSASPANRANAVRVRARPRSAAAWVRYWSGFAAWG